jgi:hypothetical protein
MEDLEFSGIIYDFDHPEAPESGTWYHLTPEDMLSMPSLVGLPIRVEHEEDIDVGEIVSCSVVNGKACVRGRLKDGPRGWAAKQLMRTKDIKELSLRHAEFVRPADGKVVHRVPIEVSLVAKGARPGSIITASKTSSPYLLLLSRHIKAGAASAPHAMDAGAPPQAAAVPQAVAAPVPAAVAGGEAATATNNALAAGLAAAVPTNVTADEREAKRARTEDNAHVTFAQAIAAKVADPDTLHSILNYVAQNMEQSVATESELVKFSEEKQAMQKKEQAMKDTNKTQVMEAVNVINNLYKHIVPNMNVSDAARESFTDMLISNAALKPEIIEFLRPMSVAASAIAAQQQKAETTNKEVELKAAMDNIARLSQKLVAARNLGATPAVHPNWQQQQQQAPAPVAAAMPPPAWQMAAPPMVDVAASGASGKKPLPAALQGLLPYGDTRCEPFSEL